VVVNEEDSDLVSLAAWLLGCLAAWLLGCLAAWREEFAMGIFSELYQINQGAA
jgi:hypothetical protein